MEEVCNLLYLSPNVPELLKILSDKNFFIKLCSLRLIENKILNIYKIVKPKIEDDLVLLNNSFDVYKQINERRKLCPF